MLKPEVKATLEHLRLRVAKVLGVTLVDNRFTFRFYVDGKLSTVHLLVEDVENA